MMVNKVFPKICQLGVWYDQKLGKKTRNSSCRDYNQIEQQQLL